MKVEKSEAYINVLLRQTRIHHMQLSTMADFKANILLTMSSVVITLSVRYLTNPQFKLATLVLMVFCLATIVLATYAVMPKVAMNSDVKTNPDIHHPKFNILFFGDFAHLEYDEFLKGYEEILADHEQVYEAQLKEIYLLGIFLAKKKYRFIRMAYITFISGFLFSGIILLITIL